MRKSLRRLCGLFFILIVLTACSSEQRSKEMPVAENGTIDLSTWDFQKDGPMRLNGKWQFYWKQLINPTALHELNKEKNEEKKHFAAVPGFWNSMKLPGIGYCTYILRITGLSTKKQQKLALKMSEAGTAYSLYFIPSSESHAIPPLMKNGIVSSDSTRGIGQCIPRLEKIDSYEKTNYIVVHISNFQHRIGGFKNELILGTEESLRSGDKKDRFLSIMTLGVLLIMFLYHTGLFLNRREDKASLFFGFFCLAISLFFMAYYRFITEFFSAPNLFIFELRNKLEDSMVFFIIPLFYSFISLTFKKEFFPIIRKIIWGISLIFLSILIILPTKDYTYIMPYYFIIAIISFLNILGALVLAIIRKRQGAVVSLVGFFISFVGAANDILHSQGLINSANIQHYTLIAFIFAQSYILSKIFSHTFRNVEIFGKENKELAEKLELLNRNLEKKVAERTSELQRSNNELEALNVHLQEARDALWGEMQLAKKIQSVLLPHTPSMNGFEIACYMDPADEVGGDYYDIIHAGGRDWIIIGDVSGHGVLAGLIMMMVQTSINLIVNEVPGITPSKLLAMINKTISKNIELLQDDKYMTITALLSHENGLFQFSGMHQDLILYRSKTKSIETIETKGMWLGVIDDISWTLNDNSMTLDTGDVLLLFTDGITEALDKSATRGSPDMSLKMFGIKKLTEVFLKNGEEHPKKIKQEIINSLRDYITHDDVTMVVIKRIE
ncbi:MAG: SpoIIE family protein phosphatase [bacterium]|nr:SpoIIE family protein phosphatase [bacterium]